MRCELVRPLPVHRFAAFAELAMYVNRPELQALCKEACGAGGVLTDTVVRKVLARATDMAARNIRAWCHEIGLCDADGTLTSHGRRTAETGEAPILEQGVYAMWGTEHPVLGNRVLHVERVRIDHQDEPEPRPLPMVPDCGVYLQSCVSGQGFMVRALPTGEGEPLGFEDTGHGSSCQFHWTVDFDAGTSRWHLSGVLDGTTNGGEVSIRPRAIDRPSKVWDLAADWFGQVPVTTGRWNTERHRLEIAFNEKLGERVLGEFRQDVLLERVDGPDGDTYENARVVGVPVAPRNASDARSWMLWRLRRRLESPGYRSVDALNAEYLAVTDDTPLQDTTAAPSVPELLSVLESERALYWRVAAGADLDPAGVPARHGSGPGYARPQEPMVVRVGPGQQWSMHELVTRLLDSAHPTRVMLCDRYVRGEANLRTLAVLRDSLRAISAQVLLDVLTERDGENPQIAGQIQAVTGRPAKWYDDVFGRSAANRPHDRYLLVDAGSRSTVWHMSNSPLDPRPGSPGPLNVHTPLRWRDMTCVRVEPASLQFPPLVNWFKPGGHA